MINYQIPKEIKAHLSKEFLSELFEQLLAIFENHTMKEIADYCAGTFGFAKAFRTVCDNQDKQELFQYWETLDWDSADWFEDEILQMLVEGSE